MTRSKERTMRIFHRTSRDAAADIRIMGFYDAIGASGLGHEHTGVWVSDQPRDVSEAEDDTLLTLRIPRELFERYEWKQSGHGFRQALIPAEDLNQAGQAKIISREAEDRWSTIRWRAHKGRLAE
jgi:hypothetical protein